ncbi:triosephosphate isomerase [Capronia coronata CBS 617.96]|uniref:Triosephosphate isomerase n=1 Tax=Capronia coronata CBS 617.96 TaxID=1182541 RepID=W9YDI9_9EURO|nr:triosephosphate isomerase [Capronia coronata CBS 617.96]EXJ90603.1 triosephosphate isomerase [Capronia coronata CBS 617.96]
MSSSSPITYPTLPPKLILTSTKAYFPPSRTISYLGSILDTKNNILPLLTSHRDQVCFVLIPDFLTIYPCAQTLTASNNLTSPNPSSWPIHLGAQNAFQSSTYGAYTGEIVPAALKELGCTVVELNHAERRRLLGESDESAAAKAAAVCALGMIPLVCIGELDKPKNTHGPLSQAVGLAMSQLTPQIEAVLRAVPPDAPVIFAYEPVWAIGAAEPAGVDYVGPVVQAIREVAGRARAGTSKAAEVKVVYGGSAGPGLWSGKTNGGNGLGKWVDGLFLGRFAHEISGIRAVVEEVVESLDKS